MLREALRRRTAGGESAGQIVATSQIRLFPDSGGGVIAAPVAGDSRAMTTIERDGRPFAALVHDAAVLTDRGLGEAVAASARLTAAHADLEADVGKWSIQVAAFHAPGSDRDRRGTQPARATAHEQARRRRCGRYSEP